MKKLLPFFTACVLIVLGACDDKLVEIEKIVHDTITVEKFVDRYYVGMDTVTIPVYIDVPTPTRTETDTVFITEIIRDTIYAQRIDSVWITQTVYLTDTIVVRETIYKDTLFQYGIYNTYNVDPEVQPMVTEFYQQAFAHGKSPNGGEMILEVVDMDPVLQAYSFDFYGQAVIRVNSNLTKDERMLPVWREMSRMTLGNTYSQDPESLLYPFYPANKIRWSNRAQFKSELNELFQ